MQPWKFCLKYNGMQLWVFPSKTEGYITQALQEVVSCCSYTTDPGLQQVWGNFKLAFARWVCSYLMNRYHTWS